MFINFCSTLSWNQTLSYQIPLANLLKRRSMLFGMRTKLLPSLNSSSRLQKQLDLLASRQLPSMPLLYISDLYVPVALPQKQQNRFIQYGIRWDWSSDHRWRTYTSSFSAKERFLKGPSTFSELRCRLELWPPVWYPGHNTGGMECYQWFCKN